MNYADIFTMNSETTDGEVLDRVYEYIEREDLSPEQIVHHIRLLLEYAKETS